MVLVLLAVACSSEPGSARGAGRDTREATDTAAVIVAFSAYQDAVATGRGADAAALVTAATLDHYERLRQLALMATADELDVEPVIDRMAVVLLRVRLDPATLETATGASLLSEAVTAGLIGQQVGALEPLSATVLRDGAASVVAVDASGRRVEVQMEREDGGWKVDLRALLGEADLALRQLAAAQGISEGELVLATVAAATGSSVGPEIFDPPT